MKTTRMFGGVAYGSEEETQLAIMQDTDADMDARVKAVDKLLNTPRILQKFAGIRMQHFYAKDTGRLVGTIATRKLNDGTIDVAAAIVNENQGHGSEEPPTRRFGCKYSLLRLISGNRGGTKFRTTDAAYLLEKGPNTEMFGQLFSPKDIKVVNFRQDELVKMIKNRTVLRMFPGQKHLPQIREPRAFKLKSKKNKQAQQISLGRRLLKFFGLDRI